MIMHPETDAATDEEAPATNRTSASDETSDAGETTKDDSETEQQGTTTPNRADDDDDDNSEFMDSESKLGDAARAAKQKIIDAKNC